jgi:hypothetical protein
MVIERVVRSGIVGCLLLFFLAATQVMTRVDADLSFPAVSTTFT